MCTVHPFSLLLLLCTTSAQEYYGQFLTPDPAELGPPSQIHLQLGGGSSYVVNWHSVINQLGGFDYKSTPASDSHLPPQLKQMDDLKQLGPFLSLVRYSHNRQCKCCNLQVLDVQQPTDRFCL